MITDSVQVNRNIVPNFYRVLQEQDEQKQIANAQELRDAFNQLIAAAHAQGPYFLGPQISFVDVQVAPWAIRLRRVLKPYRGWPDAQEGTRWASWLDAIESNEHVRATTSTDELYLDSYERYARKWLVLIDNLFLGVCCSADKRIFTVRKPAKYLPACKRNKFRAWSSIMRVPIVVIISSHHRQGFGADSRKGRRVLSFFRSDGPLPRAGSK